MFFETITLKVLYDLFYVYQNLFFLGLLSGSLFIAFDAGEDRRYTQIFFTVFGIISFTPMLAYFTIPYVARLTELNPTPSKLFANMWIGTVVFSWLFAWLWLRYGAQKIEVIKKKLTRKSSLERNKKTDVRNIDDFLPNDRKRFDALKFINYKKGFFIGMSEQNTPIYIKKSDWETSHLLLSGRTRSGKGVAAQIIGTQSIERKELFVVLDPKGDNWMPHIYKKACEKAGQPYIFLDLRQNAFPQINMFEGCDFEVIENMLIAAFGLAPKGDNADAYRSIDRKAARQAARYIADNPGVTPRDVLDALGTSWREAEEGSKLSAMVFAEMMSEMAELRAVNRRSGGIDIAKLIETGGCLYVVGDMINSRIIMMQRMILIRLMMLAKNRVQTDDMRIIRVFADEFRVHISRPFILSLGASAGWKLLCILAFQSFEDLRDCPADLDADMVRGSVIENCALQLSYRIKDEETAKVLAAQTGEILVDDETVKIDKNLALSETLRDRSVRQAERFYIDTNMIKNLPIPDIEKKTIGCGVLIGASKLAQFCFTSPIIVERSQDAIQPTTPPPAPDERDKTLEDKLAELEMIDQPAVPMQD